MLKNRKINFKKEDHPQWKGGYGHNTVTLYDTYALRLSFIENVKRSIGAHNILEVICTYCGKWFKPNRDSVARRVNFINDNINDNRTHGEHRFYCSAGCKTACPIFNKRKYPSGFKINSSREVQPELRKMVLERDTWTCQKCEETEVELHCHHITGVVQNPIESADVDNCITLCKECHKEVHKQYKCKYNELKCLEV
jgi:5-methylcytosine-specific restriction endonuclease McrA